MRGKEGERKRIRESDEKRKSWKRGREGESVKKGERESSGKKGRDRQRVTNKVRSR